MTKRHFLHLIYLFLFIFIFILLFLLFIRTVTNVSSPNFCFLEDLTTTTELLVSVAILLLLLLLLLLVVVVVISGRDAADRAVDAGSVRGRVGDSGAGTDGGWRLSRCVCVSCSFAFSRPGSCVFACFFAR
jgi:hypothetical protein